MYGNKSKAYCRCYSHCTHSFHGIDWTYTPSLYLYDCIEVEMKWHDSIDTSQIAHDSERQLIFAENNTYSPGSIWCPQQDVNWTIQKFILFPHSLSTIASKIIFESPRMKNSLFSFIQLFLSVYLWFQKSNNDRLVQDRWLLSEKMWKWCVVSLKIYVLLFPWGLSMVSFVRILARRIKNVISLISRDLWSEGA